MNTNFTKHLFDCLWNIDVLVILIPWLIYSALYDDGDSYYKLFVNWKVKVKLLGQVIEFDVHKKLISDVEGDVCKPNGQLEKHEILATELILSVINIFPI